MILMFGDVHGNFDHVLDVVEEEKPAAIIFLGDLQAQRPLEQELVGVLDKCEVWWIPGNHDTDSREDYDNLFCSALADRNLHGRVVEIDGLRIAGIGGVFREKSWYPRESAEVEPQYHSYKALIDAEMQAERWKEFRRMKAAGQAPDGLPSPPMIGKALLHKSTIFYDDWMRLFAGRADILVTHEAPTCHPHGFAAIDVLAQSMGVKVAIHGHHHDCLDYSSHVVRMGFQTFGVGFCGVTDQNGRMVVQGEFDERRSYRQERT